MTLFEPTIVVKQIVVERDGKSVYAERFHAGVNVVRGENSSGKSTILNFICYGLGGDLSDWSEVALLCTRVIVEVELNGRAATLSRYVSNQHGQPMYIFGGEFEAAAKAPITEWLKYSYRRSSNQESFSQALFRLLGIPEVASDISGNVTIHQILRLLYADQLSPVDDIFQFERFDQPSLRDAIGKLLCGAYDSSLYDNELRIRELSKEYDASDAQLNSLFSILGQTGQPLTLEWFAAEKTKLLTSEKQLMDQIARVERSAYESEARDTLTLKSQNDAYQDVRQLQEQLAEARQRKDAVELAMANSNAFIANLEHKIDALNKSDSVAAHIGDVRFSVCPACFAALDNDPSQFACHLCKTPFDTERARGRIVGLINDAAIQLRQSRLLQSDRENDLARLESKVVSLTADWERASERLAFLRKLPSTELAEELRKLNRQLGYVDSEVNNLKKTAELAGLVASLTARRNELNDEITKLKSKNEALRVSQEKRLSQSYTRISDEVRTLLKNDLRRQDSFENPKAIDFSFAKNEISVDGHTYFSASSRVILKSSFFVGFLAAALKDSAFRHPRFVMIDTIEDKGMEPERSHNFQNQILKISKESRVIHQIIFATAMISPDLDDDEFTIGKYSTRDDPTLKIA